MEVAQSVTETTGDTCTTPAIMRDILQLDTGVSSDTYHGTRMNRKALDFHTQLHDWSEAQKLVSKHTQILTASRKTETFLPVKKLAHIEYWTRQVNKYYKPYRNERPKSGSFMKIDVSKYNIKVDKHDELRRSKSAMYPNRLMVPTTGANRAMTGQRRRFFGTDMNSVRNNIVESQLHYSSQRRDLYSATTRKSKSAKTDDVKTENFDIGVSEILDYDKLDNDSSETITIIDNTEGSKNSDLESQSHIDTEVMQPQIVARSWSNRMLNVISIDDCKLTCRYRPQIIKENRKMEDDATEIPPQKSAQTQSHATKKGASPQKSVNADTKIKDVVNVNGNEADDEAEVSTDTVNDVQGSLNDLDINGHIVDTNNNTEANACPNGHVVQQFGSSECSGVSDSDSGQNSNQTGNRSSDHSAGSQSKGTKIQFKEDHCKTERTQNTPANFSSRGTSKTSYGRVTNMSNKSESSKPKNKKKKVSRTSRINHAINDVVQDRKVMNSLERDFDTRTAEFGRTVVDTTDGSHMFKKLHANLRKKIDKYMDTHSAINTKEYLEKVRKSSVS